MLQVTFTFSISIEHGVEFSGWTEPVVKLKKVSTG